MPAPRDDELAVIFREMRRASERTLESLAEQLKTTPATLVALESGEIAALPEWGETSRVVAAYTALLRLDGRPVLRRLEKQFLKAQMGRPSPDAAAAPETVPAQPELKAAKPAVVGPSPQATPPKAIKGPPLPPGAGARPSAPVVPPAPAAAPVAQRAQMPTAAMPKAEARDPKPASAPSPAGPAPVPAAGQSAPKPKTEGPADITASLTDPDPEERVPEKPRRNRKGTIITWALLLGVFGVMGLGVRHAIQHPAAVWATVDSLPEPVPQTVRSAWELVRPLEGSSQPAPAMDPQRQKTDRLPGTGAPQQGN